MTDLLTVTLPALVTMPGVEIVHVGEEWPASTGPITITHDDLTDIIAASEDPLMPRAVLKLGHDDTNVNGDDPYDYDAVPAIGRLSNFRLSADGEGVIADVVGVPAWLAYIWPTAYPHRSVELWDGDDLPYAARQTSRKHRLWCGALSLLGVWPAITALEDIQSLYGFEPVTLSAARPRVIRFAAEPERAMPKPQVTATVNLQEVTQAIYEREAEWGWVIEYGADANGTFAVYENSDGLWRVPFTVDDSDAVQLGDPTRVRFTLVDAADDDAEEPLVSAAGGATTGVIARYAPRDRASVRLLRAHPSAMSATPDSAEAQEDEMTAAELRERLGLSEDATDDEVEARLAQLPPVDDNDEDEDEDDTGDDAGGGDESGNLSADTIRQLRAQGLTVVDTDDYEQLRSTVNSLSTEREEDRVASALRGALEAGRITPAERPKWEQRLRANFSANAEILSELPVKVPVTERGHAGDADSNPEAAAFEASRKARSRRSRKES